MFKEQKILAIIPARGNSKGLINKNIKKLNGKELIGYSIEQAQKSKYIDEYFVSTDCENISEVAKNFGAKVPFLRPKELANDKASTMDVVFHTLDYFKNKGENFNIVVLLQVTSPLRTVEDIDTAIEYFFEQQANSVVSLSECTHNPLWSNVLPQNLSLENFIRDEIKNKNRQQLPIYHQFNGAIYIAKQEFLRENNNFIGENSFAYIMPKERSIDIDTIYDFKMAEFILTNELE